VDPLDAVFSALADPTRRAVALRLAEGEASVSELAERFDVTRFGSPGSSTPPGGRPSCVDRARADPRLVEPGDFTCPQGEVDLRQGGTYRLAMQTAAGGSFIVGDVDSEVDPPERLVHLALGDRPCGRRIRVARQRRVPGSRRVDGARFDAHGVQIARSPAEVRVPRRRNQRSAKA
jgi:Helix-turn-helix domain